MLHVAVYPLSSVMCQKGNGSVFLCDVSVQRGRSAISEFTRSLYRIAAHLDPADSFGSALAGPRSNSWQRTPRFDDVLMAVGSTYSHVPACVSMHLFARVERRR